MYCSSPRRTTSEIVSPRESEVSLALVQSSSLMRIALGVVPLDTVRAVIFEAFNVVVDALREAPYVYGVYRRDVPVGVVDDRDVEFPLNFGGGLHHEHGFHIEELGELLNEGAEGFYGEVECVHV